MNRKRAADIVLMVSLNILFWLFIKDADLVAQVHGYVITHQAYRLDEFIPLIFTLLLSLIYLSLRCWRESVNSAKSSEGRAAVDALTKLYNRRTLESKLAEEWQRFVRYQQNFCLIMIDIDDFRVLNETFGYREGDRFIVDIAEKLRRNIRETDFCARWGDAEFLILCPASELGAVASLAERLRTDIYCLLEGGVELSVSVGVGQAYPEKSLEMLIKEVDYSLYKAQKTGGNSVVRA